jgi:hypothetical protein
MCTKSLKNFQNQEEKEQSLHLCFVSSLVKHLFKNITTSEQETLSKAQA